MALRFRVRHASGQAALSGISGQDTSLTQLRERISELLPGRPPASQITIRAGYPPQILTGDPHASLASLGVASGNLSIEISPGAAGVSSAPAASSPPVHSQAPAASLTKPFPDGSRSPAHAAAAAAAPPAAAATPEGAMIKRIMPDDNSCLFAAVSFLMLGTRELAAELRRVVADYVLGHPLEYPPALLGQPSSDAYASWILHPDHWGGSIELAVLAAHFDTEIAAVDITTGIAHRFGEDSASQGGSGREKTQRVFVLYDGIHYDAVVRAPAPDTPESVGADQRVFDKSDAGADAGVLRLGAELRKAKKFTDVYKFSLQCGQCGAKLKGQREAQEHAEATRHTQFAEFNPNA